VNELKGNRSRRFVFAVLASIALGMPGRIVFVASVWSGIFWPFVPILFGSWFLAPLVIRSVFLYRIDLGARRKQRETAREEIGRLEARMDEAQRKAGDKN